MHDLLGYFALLLCATHFPPFFGRNAIKNGFLAFLPGWISALWPMNSFRMLFQAFESNLGCIVLAVVARYESFRWLALPSTGHGNGKKLLHAGSNYVISVKLKNILPGPFSILPGLFLNRAEKGRHKISVLRALLHPHISFFAVHPHISF